MYDLFTIEYGDNDLDTGPIDDVLCLTEPLLVCLLSATESIWLLTSLCSLIAPLLFTCFDLLTFVLRLMCTEGGRNVSCISC